MEMIVEEVCLCLATSRCHIHEETSAYYLKCATAALMNDVIIRNIFSYLSLTDFKEGRSVCSKWKRVTEALFKKRARICIDFGENGLLRVPQCVSKCSTLEELHTIFQESQQKMPFTNLRLSNEVNWSVFKLTEFFSFKGKCVMDLALVDVFLQDDSKEKNSFKLYDLMIFSNKILTHLQTLKISVREEQKKNEKFTRFKFCLRDIARIKYLKLESCTIQLQDEIILTAAELEFNDIIFCRNNVPVKSVFLNDYVNLKLIDELTVSFCQCEIVLDFIGNYNFKCLFLQRVTVLNIELSHWNIDYLFLADVPFTVNTRLKVKRFFVFSTKCSLKVLPEMIEKLILFNAHIFDDTPWNFNLPNLQVLEISGAVNIKNSFPLLIGFKNLVALHILSFEFLCIDVRMIPQFLKRLHLTGPDFEFVEYESRISLPTLILVVDEEAPNSLELVEKVTTVFIVNNFVLVVPNIEPDLGFSLLKQLLDQSIYRIIFGCLEWKNFEELDHPFLLLSNTKEQVQNYCFENGVYKAISGSTMYMEVNYDCMYPVYKSLCDVA